MPRIPASTLSEFCLLIRAGPAGAKAPLHGLPVDGLKHHLEQTMRYFMLFIAEQHRGSARLPLGLSVATLCDIPTGFRHPGRPHWPLH